MGHTMFHKTAEELVAAWDRGDTIWSLSMGGLGPGYEQAIQVMAVEFARAGIGSVRPSDNKAADAAWEAICSPVLSRIDGEIGGASGSMYGVAKWLAFQWVHGGGPAALMARAREYGQDDRMIQVSKSWPKADAR